MCLANAYLHTNNTNTHTQPNTHPGMHAQNRLPSNLQTSTKEKEEKPPPPPHTHTQPCTATCTVPTLQHSRVQLEWGKIQKKTLRYDWRVRSSNKSNLHTPRLRSEYAWENKTICLEADHPLSLDYCTHLRDFYLPLGKQSGWFSAHLLMVSHNKLDLE